MLKQNIDEYHIILEEITSVKKCITNYISFALFGVGIVCVIIAKYTSAFDTLTLALISELASFLITLVMIIIYSKFAAHNRLVGYSELITLERHNKPDKNEPLCGWEFCYSEFRKINTSLKSSLNRVINVDFKGISKKYVTDYLNKNVSKTLPTSSRNIRKGLTVLVRLISGNSTTTSWQFSGHVFALFFSTFTIFSIAAISFIFKENLFSEIVLSRNYFKAVLLLVFFIFTSLQYLVWLVFVGKLYDLIEGADSIESCLIKFLPHRAIFMNFNGYTPSYNLINICLTDLIVSREYSETERENNTNQHSFLSIIQRGKIKSNTASKSGFFGLDSLPDSSLESALKSGDKIIFCIPERSFEQLAINDLYRCKTRLSNQGYKISKKLNYEFIILENENMDDFIKESYANKQTVIWYQGTMCE